MRRFSRLALIVFCLPWVAWSQEHSPGQLVIRGTVSLESGALPNGLQVEVDDLNHHLTVDRVFLMPNGDFEFRNLQAGSYAIRITNMRGDSVREEFVTISGNGGPLSISLPGGNVAQPSSGVVSAARLLHPIRPKAYKEFWRSQKAFRAGDIQSSVQHLEKAIEIDPDYMEAHNNLGVRYLSLDQFDKALTEFQRTVNLDPTSAKGHLNLSSALSILRRYPEAESAARRAVQLDPSSIQASYLLGQILAAEGRDSDETIARLEGAVDRYPKARVVLARIMVRQGRIDEAVEQLRAYLKSGNPEKRQEVESWIARLQP